MIEKRVSGLCSSRVMFEKHAPFYNKALKNSGYKDDIKYIEHTEQRLPKKKRARYNTYWYNPPYNKAVTTKVGEKFLQLIDKHFPVGSKWNVHFNRKTIKVSYCCTRNMASHISGHNNKVLKEAAETEGEKRKKNKPCPTKNDPCPLGGEYEGKCRTKEVVYQALITSGNQVWNYFGQTRNEFHMRWGQHKNDMRNEERKGTALSAKVRELKDAGKAFDIKTNIIREAHSYKTGDSNCDLCLTEKLCIALNHKAPPKLLKLPRGCLLLNIRSEVTGGCNHRIDYRLIGRQNSKNR